jgi:hypothetical protein
LLISRIKNFNIEHAHKREYDAFQNRLREKYKLAGLENYVLDGPLSAGYWSANPRIAILNLEIYGYEKCGEVMVNLDCVKGWMSATGGKIKTKTSRYTSIFATALQNSLKLGAPASPASLKNSCNEFNALVVGIANISYLNVRKTSNPVSRQDIQSIANESSGESLAILKEQFKILDPGLIIVGGHQGCAAANRIFNLGGNLKYRGIANLPNGAEVVSVKHFSRVSCLDMAVVIEGIKQRRRGNDAH